MGLKFPPLTDEQLTEMRRSKLFKKGVYAFAVNEAEDKISQANNPYIKLMVTLMDNDGTSTQVFDMLMESMHFKLKHFCDFTGLGEEYAKGELSAKMCKGRSGYCKVDIELGKPKGDFAPGEYYPDKNVIKDYVKEIIAPPGSNTFFNDDISL